MCLILRVRGGAVDYAGGNEGRCCVDPSGLPSEAAALARLVDLSRGPVAAACLVVGYEGDPLDPLFGAARDRA
ncbi:hypothetical protein DEJ44_00100 [Streptomyces venezuelae]|nr:hypothetical protein DEJ44_00100 [Streptomyces venezuelae]